jgi:hypothetical protein
MGKFVRLLLNRGEAPAGRVIGPEHLSIMQRPRTTLAATAGLRTGYGAGLATYDVDGFPLLVHSGGIEGFSSLFGYSTSHDAGFVVLLNSNVSGAARLRIASLAVRYLTAAVDPPVGAMATVSADRLRSHAGYYHDANPRMQATAFLSWLLSGQTITVNGARLRSVSIAGDTIDLIPVSETSFRRPDESEATHVFTVNEHGVAVLAGGIAGQLYAERRPRWQLEIVRVPVVLSAGLVLTPLVMLMPWTVQACRATPPTFWRLKVCLLISAFTSLVSGLAFMAAGGRELGTPTIWSVSFCLGTILLPATSVLTLACIFHVWCAGEGRWLRAYAIVIAVAGVIISVYLFRWGMIGFRSWAY